MARTISMLISFIFTALFAASQPEWHLKKDKDGIKVYTDNSDTSKFNSIKVECTLDGTCERLISILKDVENHKKWVYATKTSYPIKAVSENEQLYYAETSLPWPFDNRDVVIRMTIFPGQKANECTIITLGEPEKLPVKKGIVRIPYFNSRYEVRGAGDKKINITYYLESDPGGKLPPWLVNMFSVKGPYETFSNLASLLKQ